jgi:serine/threonine protein kinase/tetratricopeptide (TPR) repeat protein
MAEMVNPQTQTLNRRLFPRTPQVGSDDLPRTSRLTDLRPPHADDDLYDVATSFQDVRLRDPGEVQSWRDSFPAVAAHADLFLDLHRTDPQAAHRLAEAVTAMPEVGSDFVGFRLLAELGRGALSQVFLARQGDVANRYVVIKVAPDIAGETQTLGQLQHTNVVPLYSVHRSGPLCAVCMPFYGSTTLADVLKSLHGREALPNSGAELISTLVDRLSTVPDGVPQPVAPSVAGVSDPGPASLRPATGAPGSNGLTDSSTRLVGPTRGRSNAILHMLQKLSYVEAVLWLGSRLADGLAHAHEHGILHRDLKPANVLLTDDGQPMLLDFNLSHDTKLSGSATAAQAGGTLPFMAPEQLQAYQAQTCSLNYTSDLYALGVILFELLTGRHPFSTPTGPIKAVLDQMIADRLQPPPAVRCWNKAVSPAVEAIVRKCLEPNPARRYASARALQDDIERQLADLPLKHIPEPSYRERARKWVRRHPRLMSSTTMLAACGILLAGLAGGFVARGQRLAKLEAHATYDQFVENKHVAQFLLTAKTDDVVQVNRGVAACRAGLDLYHVLDNASWKDQAAVRLLPDEERDQLGEDVGGLLILLARATSMQAEENPEPAGQENGFKAALWLNQMAEAAFGENPPAKALWAQRSKLAEKLGEADAAKELAEKAAKQPMQTVTDRYLVASDYVSGGRMRDALPLLKDATQKNPQDYQSWFLLGVCYDGLAQDALAASCYSTCIALVPTSHQAHFNRGLARHKQGDYSGAIDDFDRVIHLQPEIAEAYTDRALARQRKRDYAAAIADLTKALDLGADRARIHLLRSVVRHESGDVEGAKKDLAEGLRQQPQDELGWVTRGWARMRSKDLTGALADFDEALKLNSRSLVALQNKATSLSQLGRNADALPVLDREIEIYPDYVKARAGRVVVLARLGRRDDSQKEAHEVLQRDRGPVAKYQVASAFALTSKTNPEDRAAALRLLSESLKGGLLSLNLNNGNTWFKELATDDKDLDLIRDCPEFRTIVDAAKVIHSGMAAK